MGWSSSTSQESLTSHTWSRYTNCMNLSELSVAKKKNGGNQRRTHRNFFSLNKKEWKILLKKKENRVTVTHQQQQMMSDFSSCKGASDSHAISKIELKKKTKKQKQNVFVEMKGLAVFSRLPMLPVDIGKREWTCLRVGKNKTSTGPRIGLCVSTVCWDVILRFPLGAANNVSRFLYSIHNKQTNNKWHIHSSSLYDSQKPRPLCCSRSMKI